MATKKKVPVIKKAVKKAPAKKTATRKPRVKKAEKVVEAQNSPIEAEGQVFEQNQTDGYTEIGAPIPVSVELSDYEYIDLRDLDPRIRALLLIDLSLEGYLLSGGLRDPIHWLEEGVLKSLQILKFNHVNKLIIHVPFDSVGDGAEIYMPTNIIGGLVIQEMIRVPRMPDKVELGGIVYTRDN